MSPIRRQYEPTPSSCAAVRRDLRQFLAGSGLAEAVVDDCVLVANELATNVADHAGTPFVVAVTVSAGSVRLEVADGSTLPAVLQPHDPSAPRGRGLQMVDALCSGWTCVPHATGKIVVAEIALNPVPVAG